MDTSTQSRYIAVGMLQAGKTPAETWEALVSSGMDGGAAEALVKEVIETQRVANNAAGQPGIYVSANLNSAKTGNFWLGLLAGFFCSCFALIVSFLWDDMGTETRKGIHAGFAFSMFLALIRVLAKAAG